MTISWYVQQQFYAAATPEGEALVGLPVHCVAYGSMTGSQDWLANLTASPPPKTTTSTKATHRPRKRPNVWSEEEHERFLLGLEMFPQGPLKEIAAVVGTRSTRQTITHAQKYRHKINRRMKWAALLQDMAVSVKAKTENHATSPCAVETDDVDMMLSTANSPMGVASPLEVSSETFDATIDESDLQDLLAHLNVPTDVSLCRRTSIQFHSLPYVFTIYYNPVRIFTMVIFFVVICVERS